MTSIDELQAAISKGSIGNLIADFKQAKMELAILKNENDFIKKEVKRLEI
jgi:cell division protein FtsB